MASLEEKRWPMFTRLWCENLKKKRPLGDLGANGRHIGKKNGTAGYGMDSSGSLKIQERLLKIRL